MWNPLVALELLSPTMVRKGLDHQHLGPVTNAMVAFGCQNAALIHLSVEERRSEMLAE